MSKIVLYNLYGNDAEIVEQQMLGRTFWTLNTRAFYKCDNNELQISGCPAIMIGDMLEDVDSNLYIVKNINPENEVITFTMEKVGIS